MVFTYKEMEARSMPLWYSKDHKFPKRGTSWKSSGVVKSKMWTCWHLGIGHDSDWWCIFFVLAAGAGKLASSMLQLVGCGQQSKSKFAAYACPYSAPSSGTELLLFPLFCELPLNDICLQQLHLLYRALRYGQRLYHPPLSPSPKPT